MSTDAARTPTLSIIIPTYNAASTLRAQLEALAASIDADTEVIVVDNRSTDGSRSIAAEFAAAHPQFRVVDASDRQGEPHARNVGARAARTDALAFCDADDVVSPGWAAAMRDALQHHQFVTGPADVDRLNAAWLSDVRGRRMFGEIPRTVDGVPFAHGCNFAVRREAFEAVGGFDEAWPMGCDIEFSIRLHRHGVQLAWVPEALVHYRHRTHWRARWRQAVAFGRATDRLRRLTGRRANVVVRCWRQRRRVAWLLVRIPRLHRRAFRARWLFTLALVVGEIRGAH